MGLPRMGKLSEDSGRRSTRLSRLTKRERRTVIPREIFSPLSHGSTKLDRDTAEIITNGTA